MHRRPSVLVRFNVALQALGRVRSRSASFTVLATVVFAASGFTMHGLGKAEICKGSEAVEALIVRQMVEHGALLFPVLNGHDPMYKPPLFHWTATALAYAVGAHDVTERTVRLPSALYAIAGILLTMLFVYRWLGLANALLAGVLLLASYQYISQGRFGRVDMTLTFCETLSLCSVLWWLEAREIDDGRTRESTGSAVRLTAAHYIFAGALGLGVLAKGPIGMLLPLLTVSIFLIVAARWRDARALCRPGPVVVFVMLSSAWYLMCFVRQEVGILDRQIASENFGRFVGNLGWMPPWYYVRPLLFGSIPLSILAPIAVVSALRSPARTAESLGGRPATVPRVLAIFWCVTVIFFSIAAYKRRTYLLPLAPASSMLVVWWLSTRARRRQRHLLGGAVIVTCLMMIGLNLLFIRHTESAACHGTSQRQAAAALRGAVPDGEELHSYGVGLEALAPLLFYLDRTVPPITGALANATAGYLLVPTRNQAGDDDATGWRAVLSVNAGPTRFTLVKVVRSVASRTGSPPAPAAHLAQEPPAD